MIAQTESIPQVTNHLHDIRSGASEPQVCECSDGVERVIKVVGPCTGGTLASDWVGSLLAVRLGILMPAPCLCLLEAQAKATFPGTLRNRCSVGYVLGTTYIQPAGNVLGLASITACVNHQELLSSLLVLDSWIGTADRMRPEFGRNLLVDREEQRHRLMAIDFGMSFPGVFVPLLGMGGTAPQVEAISNETIRHLLSYDAASVVLGDVEALSEAELGGFVNMVPESWVSQDLKGKMLSFLIQRRSSLRPCVEEYLSP